MKYLIILSVCLVLWQNNCQKSEANTKTVAKSETKTSEENSSRRDNLMADTKQTLCQMTIDLPALEGYFHPTAPNRKPFLVLKNEQTENLSLIKFGEAVKLISSAEAKSKELPFFEFTSIEIKDKTASISFKYAVEGLKGKVNFKKDGDHWEVESKEIIET